MVDQDGVVLNSSYLLTEDITELLENSKKAGLIIVPNSDTPVERLANNFEAAVGFRPFVTIGEKGAVVNIGDQYFKAANIEGISEYIANLGEVFRAFGAQVVKGDSATWIREQKHFLPNKKTIVIDGFRRASIAFYLRMTDDIGIAQVNEKWAEEGLSLVSELSLPLGLETYDYNPKYGIAISNAKGISKTSGYKLLKERYPEAEFYMIGDGAIDIIRDNSVRHLAVANAVPEFKEKAVYVSPLEITQGFADCINWIRLNDSH
jgi:hydroxymethylpyrimidine pyrophosphatase-like HAD family hydrolase